TAEAGHRTGGTRSWAHYGARALVRHPEDPTKKLSSLAEVTVTTSPIYLLGDARPVAPGQPAHHPGRHRRFDGRRREFGTPHHHPLSGRIPGGANHWRAARSRRAIGGPWTCRASGWLSPLKGRN